MIYKRNTIQDLIADTKDHIKVTFSPRWCLIVDEKDREYMDENWWITDGFALWLVPTVETSPVSKLRKVLAQSKLRTEFENDLVKKRGKGELLRRPQLKTIKNGLLGLDADSYEDAVEFELDFHPASGFSVLCRSGSGIESRLHTRYLFRYDDLASEFAMFDGYTIQVSDESKVVRVVNKDGVLFGAAAPIIGLEKMEY